MAQGFKIRVARKTAKNGNRYCSLNLGSLGQLLIWDGEPDDEFWNAFLLERETKNEPQSKPANVVDWQRPLDKSRQASKPFFSDPLPEAWRDDHTA